MDERMTSADRPDRPLRGTRRRQLFHPSVNTIARASIFGGVVILAALGWVIASITTSDYVNNTNVAVAQPVPFSHEHHVKGLGISCQYCHSSVTESSSAGMPATQTCMTCHSQIWTNAEILKPVRDSYATGVPLQWNRVYDLPDFVYFNHSIHVKKGIGCSSCHGQVNNMPLMRKAQPLFMNWCLGCHRAPEKFIRPRDQVFSMEWTPPANQISLGQQLVQEYHVNKGKLTNCSICHR